MFRMGDEFMQTQGGNNNPYNQDNETSWLDWRRLEQNQEMFYFFKRMIAFRKTHPVLGRSTFWRDNIRWFGAEQPQVDMSFNSQTLAYWLQGDSDANRGLYVMVNGSPQPTTFQIHAMNVCGWNRAIDTSLPYPNDIAYVGTIVPHRPATYRVNPRSVVVFESNA